MSQNHSLIRIISQNVPHTCGLIICFDVHGVLDRMPVEDLNALESLLARYQPTVCCMIISYGRGDKHWPISAGDECKWRNIVQMCRLCFFPYQRPFEGEGNTGGQVYKRGNMPNKFWSFAGSKSKLVNELDTPCWLVDDKHFDLREIHLMLQIPRHSRKVRIIRNMLEEYFSQRAERNHQEVCSVAQIEHWKQEHNHQTCAL